MMPDANLLLRDPLLAQCPGVTLTRLLPHLEERHFAAGELLYRTGDAASGLYLLASGRVSLQTAAGEREFPATAARFGEECLTDADRYLSDARALTPVVAGFLPRSCLLPVLAEQPGLQAGFMQSLLATLTVTATATAPPPTLSAQTASTVATAGSGLRALGWLMAILLPLAVLWLTQRVGMERNAGMFLAIFTATVVMWAWSLVDDYLPGLFAVMGILIAGLAPPSVILSGFASDGFMMALSILGLGTVLVSSGLSYRALLLMLQHLPTSRFWQNLGLMSIGIFLTPLLPTINGRVALIAPFYVDMMRSLRLPERGAAATQLAVSAFAGVSLFSAIFLTSKSVNFAVFSLLPVQTQDHFQGFKWVAAAGVVALVLLAGHALLASLLFRSKEPLRLSRELIAAQLAMLGRPNRREWAALLGIAVFIGGMLTTHLHQVQAPWMGLAIFYGLLLFGSLSRDELKKRIDWPFLLYLSGLTGLVNAFNHLGIDCLLAAALPALGTTMREDFGLFILLLFAVIFVIRLAVPISASIVILASLLMPLAEVSGVNPWVVGFCVLLLGEIWFFPYQCSYYLQFQAVNRRQPMYLESSFLIYNAAMNFARLAAVYFSIPFWKAFGLL
jgi:DASS family divalent anion:Na+ symporter